MSNFDYEEGDKKHVLEACRREHYENIVLGEETYCEAGNKCPECEGDCLYRIKNKDGKDVCMNLEKRGH